MALNHWRDKGVITPEQYTLLDALSRREPFSVFIELNILLYAGVVAFIGGLAWTAETYSRQLGDLLVIAALSAILTACFWYCFSRAQPWSAAETPSPNLIFDYVLYLGALGPGQVELSLPGKRKRFHLLTGHWDTYLLATAGFFFIRAYRFANRFVLSLALSALAGWFGLKTSHWPGSNDNSYRTIAILYSVVTGLAGIALRRLAIKAHFFLTFLNLAAKCFPGRRSLRSFQPCRLPAVVSASHCGMRRFGGVRPHAKAVLLCRLCRDLRLRGPQFRAHAGRE